MDLYLVIVIIMLALAVSGLIVGVANDAVNFLNSALGSRVAPRYVIMTVASVGIIVGALTSSGMMEVARSGVFHPEMFTFSEVMLLFLAVMFTNVILLDIFNTLGMPTSTTVSLVFGLLGAAVGICIFKISSDTLATLPDGTKATMGDMINTGNAMVIIGGILLSVVIAFVFGTVIMYITRLIFSFRYKKNLKTFGSVWCGIALTAITYFAVFKGLKGTNIIPADWMAWMETHKMVFLGVLLVGWSIIMFLLYLVKVNILKITVLAGTFSLALAFAGNDLVNFIGVFVAGVDAYKIVHASGDTNMLMSGLNEPVVANLLVLFISGTIMVVTLWFSKKAQTVSDTEINLARQDAGIERFGSTSVSRAIVRTAINFNRNYEKYMPERIQRFVASRFVPARNKDKAPFDLIRATVNLTVASLLISAATSLQLPLSTTYVTFMVAMGSSLSDRAWGRESAVYRITGVLTVIAGWFFTALIAFTIAFVVAAVLMWGQGIAVAALTLLCGYLMVQSTLVHNRKLKKEAEKQAEHEATDEKSIVGRSVKEVTETMSKVTTIYNQTLIGLFNEDRKLLKKMVRESEELYQVAHERKHEVLPTLLGMQENYLETGHYYVQVVDYLDEVAKALVHITRPSFDHINNNHEGFRVDQLEDLKRVNDQVSAIYARINKMLSTNNFSDLDNILRMRDELFDILAAAIKSQIKRVKAKASTTRSSILYLTIINETKTMVLQSRNLLKAQKYFSETDKSSLSREAMEK